MPYLGRNTVLSWPSHAAQSQRDFHASHGDNSNNNPHHRPSNNALQYCVHSAHIPADRLVCGEYSFVLLRASNESHKTDVCRISPRQTT